MSYVDVPLERWEAEVLSKMGLPPHVEQHIATMARLHRENRYDRTADGVERVTGIPPQIDRGVRGRPQGLLPGLSPLAQP